MRRQASAERGRRAQDNAGCRSRTSASARSASVASQARRDTFCKPNKSEREQAAPGWPARNSSSAQSASVALRDGLLEPSESTGLRGRGALSRELDNLAMRSASALLPRSLPARTRPCCRRWASSIRSSQDPRAYLHPTARDNVHALSFLEEPPLDERSPTVLGLLSGDQLRPDALQPNPNFMRLAHEILRGRVGEAAGLKTMAVARGSPGYIHISDERNMPVANRTAEPDECVGASSPPLIVQHLRLGASRGR